MTLLNFALDRRGAVIVTDTLITSGRDGDPVEYLFGAKAIAVPHLRLVVAGAGERALLLRSLAPLLWGLPPADVDDLIEPTTERLRRASCELERKVRATVYYFGVDRRDVVTGFRFQSPNFVAERIAAGLTCVSPARMDGPTASSDFHRGPDNDVSTAPSAKWPWHDRVRAIHEATTWQQHHPTVGGRLHVTTLTPDCIHQHWLGELSPSPRAAEPASPLSPSQEKHS